MSDYFALILARSGSKGIPNKNIKTCGGKPLLAWSIESALESNRINGEVFVSSDSAEYLELSQKWGAKSIQRPPEISGDTASSELAIHHAIEVWTQQGQCPKNIVFLQVTSPLRPLRCLDLAIAQFEAQSLNSLLAVEPLRDHFIWSGAGEHGARALNHDHSQRKRRQEIELTYLENGSFYIFQTDNFLKHNNRLGGKIGHFSMDRLHSVQIDNEDEFELCDFILRSRVK
jgi:CMP-N,N'-diacetyllegionaminic acid synthase